MTYLSEVLIDSPFKYLRLEETTGGFTDSGSNSSQGASAAGTAVAANRGVTGLQGLAVNFTGTSTSWISIPTNYTFTTDNRFSAEALIKTSQATGVDRPVVAYGVGGRGFRMGVDTTGKPYFETTNANGTIRATHTKVVNDGAWHHIVGVVDTSLGTTIYVDGVAVTNASTITGTQSSVADYTYIGGVQASGGFIGTIDEVAVYDQALTSARVNAHYQASGLVATNAGYTAQAAAVSVAMPNTGVTAVKVISTSFAAGVSTVTAALVNPAVSTTKTAKVITTALGVSAAMPDVKLISNVKKYLPTSEIYSGPTGANNGTTSLTETYDISDITGGMSVATAILRVKPDASMQPPGVSLIGNDGNTLQYTNVDWGTTGAYRTLDITDVVNRWVTGELVNHQLYLYISNHTISGAGATEADDRPLIMATLQKTVNAPASALNASVAMPTVNVTATQVHTPHTEAVGAILTGVSMVGVVVTTEVNPDAYTAAQPIELFVSAGEVVAIGGHDQTVDQSGSMSAQVEMLGDISVSNQTDKVIKAGPMAISNRLVGIYYAAADRYFKRLTNDLSLFNPALPLGTAPKDMWYSFRDNAMPSDVGGTPEHGEGYRQRGGVILSGDDYIVPPEDVFIINNSGLGRPAGYAGFEMSIKTTSQSGVIMAGHGNKFSLEIEDGSLVIATWFASTTSTTSATFGRTKTKVKIADGEWHLLSYSPTTIYLDGKVVWRRFSGWENSGYDGVARIGTYDSVNTYADAYGVVPKMPNLVGEISDVVLFGSTKSDAWHTAAYYDWSEALVIAPAAISAGKVEMVQATAKGNQPRMLVIYGLLNGPVGSHFASGEAYNDYLQGIGIGSSDAQAVGTDIFGVYHNAAFATATWEDRGFKCYPVHIFMRTGAAAGVVTQEQAASQMQQYFIDDETGEIRFIDLLNDLDEPIENFDAISFVNWPTANMGGSDGITDTSDLPWFVTPTNEFRYDKERERLINGIRGAVDKGVALFVGDPRMALDLGIATGFDVHPTPLSQSDPHAQQRDDQLTSEADIYADAKAAGVYNGYGPKGRYIDINSIDFRRIVSTATDFSEFPSWYTSELLKYEAYDRLNPYADVYAQNVDYLENGLIIGAKFPLATAHNMPIGNSSYGAVRNIYSLRPEGLVGQVIAKEDDGYFAGSTWTDNPFKNNATTVLLEKGTILNGKPLGGRIFVEVMEGMDGYVAPFKHGDAFKAYFHGINAPSIPTNVGWKYVNDPRPTPTKPNRTVTIQVPADAVYDPLKKKWISPTYAEVGHTDWDYDTRRYRATASSITSSATNGTQTYTYAGKTSTVKTVGASGAVEMPIVIIEENGVTVEQLPMVGMKDRGFNWMLQKPWETEPGAVRVNAGAMEVDVKVNEASTKTVKHTTVGAQPMAANVSMIRPPAYLEADAVISTFPMETRVDMNNTQKVIYVEPIVFNVVVNSTTSSSSNEGGFTFYLRDEAITLYLGDE